jgi:hypothetical protein
MFIVFTVALLTCSVCRKPRITLMTVRFSVGIVLLPLELTWSVSSMDATWYAAEPAIPFIRSHFPLEPFCVSLVSTPQLFTSFPSFLPSYFSLQWPPGIVLFFLCSVNDRRFLSVYWAEIGNFNDVDWSEGCCCVVSCKVGILKTRGAQVPGARSYGRLNCVQWRLMLVGSVVGSNLMSPLSCREVWCESETFGKTLTLVECKTGRWHRGTVVAVGLKAVWAARWS